MMKRQAPWIRTTQDPLKEIFLEWMMRLMLLLITTVLRSIKYHIFMCTELCFFSQIYYSTRFSNSYPTLFSFRILVFLPWTHPVWVQLHLKKGPTHPENELHSQLLMRRSAVCLSAMTHNTSSLYTKYTHRQVKKCKTGRCSRSKMICYS